VAPALNLAPLENALTTLTASAERFDTAFAMAGGNAMAANAAMRQVEQALTSPLGLPRRPWYQHLLYAPGYYTGYGVKTLPGLREGIEQGQWQEAEAEASRIAERLVAAARLIDEAAAALRGGKPAG
jgi:N-acetylated-alpha-linked acidic dipeptidase